MLTIEKTVTMSPEQWEIVIEGMRNPKNSWDRMDSDFDLCCDSIACDTCPAQGSDDCVDKLKMTYDNINLGPNDHGLMMNLADGGPVHAKYRRMIPVWVTINAPLYWWKEFDTYKVGTVCNSCSTMHKIHAKEFTRDDFSYEHLFDFMVGDVEHLPIDILDYTIDCLNMSREKFLECSERLKHNNFENWNEGMACKADQKEYWWQMIQLLPTSYNQKRTIMLNYEVLVNIYTWRKNHKLDEWHVFCDWIESLPYSELIIGEKNEH